MSRSQHKLKPSPRPLFSCGMFRNCTMSVLSPRTPPNTAASFLQPPPASPSPSPAPPATSQPAAAPNPSSSSSSSSSSASHSFTQWRFPLHLNQHHQPPPEPQPPPYPESISNQSIDLTEAFHSAEIHFADGDSRQAVSLLVQSLATADPPPPATAGVIAGVVAALRVAETARAAAKVFLALVLAEENRRPALEAGAVAAAVEAVASPEAGGTTTVKERTLAALELLCTVEDGATAVRGHPLAAKALAGAVEAMAGRGRECAIGVLAAIYGGDWAAAAPEEVVRAVVVALQGECTARGRRKGAQLLLALKETAPGC
ncbi:hypothetical protein KSP39_PZI011199 [Platanthera zijinensis]|uniref:U-box domain-containing protein n=1 Tax=Platanthera zijinensis TaxID=2320716 RepID=A0AAP0BHP1_9ASPA